MVLEAERLTPFCSPRPPRHEVLIRTTFDEDLAEKALCMGRARVWMVGGSSASKRVGFISSALVLFFLFQVPFFYLLLLLFCFVFVVFQEASSLICSRIFLDFLLRAFFIL